MTRQTIPERKDIAADHQWDLTPLFTSDEEWEKLMVDVESQIDHYDDYKGRLMESAEILKEAIDFHLSLRRQLDRLYTYAHLKSDEDKSNQFYLGIHQRSVSLHVRASESASYMTPEIQAIPDDQMRSFLEDDLLAKYKFYLKKLLRYKPHTRSEKIEQVLAMSQEMAQTPSQVFGQLDNVDLNFGHLEDEKGEKVELVRNEDYWKGTEPWDQVEIRPITDVSAREAALLAGEPFFNTIRSITTTGIHWRRPCCTALKRTCFTPACAILTIAGPRRCLPTVFRTAFMTTSSRRSKATWPRYLSI